MILHPFKSFLFACKCRIYVKNYITYITISLNCRKNVYFWKYMYIFPRTFSLGVSNMLSKSTPTILRNEKW